MMKSYLPLAFVLTFALLRSIKRAKIDLRKP